MSLTGHGFDLDIDGLDPVEDGSSVLLTGSDLDALESVFFRLASPTNGEHPLVVSTLHGDRAIRRKLDADAKPTVITAEGPSRDDRVSVVDEVGNLTEIGMELSARFQELADEDVRAGVFHTTDLCVAADDTRSVYRFLNSNVLANLRRQSAVGVVAIHTDDEVQANVDSIVVGMETSFSARIHVTEASHREATVEVSGLSTDGEFTVDL